MVDEVLLLTEHNPDWGYDRIAETMRYLDYDVCASTVRHILDDHWEFMHPRKERHWLYRADELFSDCVLALGCALSQRKEDIGLAKDILFGACRFFHGLARVDNVLLYSWRLLSVV